jgi:hypothetical protein
VHLFDTVATDSFRGGVTVTASSRLDGAEANAVYNPSLAMAPHLVLLGGFRFAKLDERLSIRSDVTHDHTDSTMFDTALGLPIGTSTVDNSTSTLTTRFDQFDTRNTFYGGQVGARTEYRWGKVSLEGGAKVALGSMHESVDIIGATNTSTTGSATPTRGIMLAGIPLNIPNGLNQSFSSSSQTLGGLFAQQTNIGHHSRDEFAVIPEANIKVGYQITDNIRATIGYTFLYMSDVVRPGSQIDRSISPGLLSSPPSTDGATHPLSTLRSTDFWAQGIDFGLEFRY